MGYRPSVFIASSSESLAVARALQRELDSVGEVSVWDQAQFKPTRFPLESLMEILGRSDLGIFVFAPDDRVGENQRPVVRDNVLIELGLFIGRLGRERVAIVVRDDVQPKIPSDLHGLHLLKYRFDRSDRNLAASIAPAAEAIRVMLSDIVPSAAAKPRELETPLTTLRLQLSRNQRELPGFFEEHKKCSVRDLMLLFKGWTQGELHYRLEQLRLYSFLGISDGSGESAESATKVYHLQPRYVLELKKSPPPLEHDTLSIADDGTGEWHLPPVTDTVPLDGPGGGREGRKPGR